MFSGWRDQDPSPQLPLDGAKLQARIPQYDQVAVLRPLTRCEQSSEQPSILF